MGRNRAARGAAEVSSGALFGQPTPADDKPHYHDHRARLRARFEAHGATALADYELLELVVFRLVTRRDTKPLAKALLARFGAIADILGADAGQIAEVDGAGPSVAADLKALHALFVRAGAQSLRDRDVLSSWSALIAYLQRDLQHETREQFRVLFLDVKNQLIADEKLADGTIDHAAVYPREVVHRALQHGAASLILVHNHPSGDPKPSPADVSITREIAAAAKTLSIHVHDHVIIARRGAVSLRQLGLMGERR